jgi:uncharacterized protein YndB with AHSA1/START domain
MTFRGEIAIPASPAKVWAIVSDPSLMPLWNPKCVQCERLDAPVRRGSRYQAIFSMAGPGQKTSCEVIECAPAGILKTRYTGKAFRKGGYVEEVFQLKPSSTGTLLTHAVDFTHAGLPWFVRLLMRVIHVLGHGVGRSSLERIGDLEQTRRHQDNPT